MARESTIFLIDSDVAERRTLGALLLKEGYRLEAYASAEEFLEYFELDCVACLVAELQMPRMTGLELQEQLRERDVSLPVILISDTAEVSTAVQAMRNGAIDFLVRPIDDRVLLERVEEAMVLDQADHAVQVRRERVAALMEALSKREAEVMELLVRGQTTKQIASELGISTKTIDVHRTQVLAKMGVDNVVELVILSRDAE